VPANHFQKGDKHPKYGLVPANAAGVYIYDLEGKFVAECVSRVAAASYLGVSTSCIYSAISRGSVVKGSYRVVSAKSNI